MSGPRSAGGVLLVLDGWGHSEETAGNALAQANTPTLDLLRSKCPSSLLSASGESVGLLPGTVGNSEIGHLVIGAGRPLPYDSLLVQRRIDSGELRADQQLNALAQRVAQNDKALHLIGLCSDGQIHASVEHLTELLAVAAAQSVPRVWIHAITDGRDVADGTAASYLQRVREMATEAGTGRLATVMGRGYALDKAGNTTLTRAAGLAIARAQGKSAADPADAATAPERGDEWIPPTVFTGYRCIDDSDGVVFFNFRSDRIQQLADFILDHLAETGRAVEAMSLAQYDTRNPIRPVVTRSEASGGLADELERRGLRSIRIAEKEKFEHVTYYLNGRDDRPRPLEEHVLVASAESSNYLERPEMNLGRVTDQLCGALERSDVALVIANLANIDVVGHTGNHAATVSAASTPTVRSSRSSPPPRRRGAGHCSSATTAMPSR